MCVFVNSCTAVVVYHNKTHTKRPLKSHGQLCSNTDSTAEPAADLHEVKLRHLTNGRRHSSLSLKINDSAGFC